MQASRSRHDDDEDDDDDEEGCIRELEDMMESLTRRMIKSELEDFELVALLVCLFLFQQF